MGPHRLEAQDSGFSRRQQGFKSPWGCFQNKAFGGNIEGFFGSLEDLFFQKVRMKFE